MDILPDSRAKRATNVVRGAGQNWVPIFCANCGADGGLVPEENMSFAFYLCQACADRVGPIAHTYMMPDEVFWKRVEEEQLEKYGRVLGPAELARALENENHPLAKLAKDRLASLKRQS